MSYAGDMTSAEVAEEAEHERADLAHTLEQLRQNLQPRNVVDEVMSQARLNSADVSDRMLRVVQANPVASAIIAIGAAMLFGAGRRSRPRASDVDRSWSDRDRFPSGASPDPHLNPGHRTDTPGTYPTFPDRDLRDWDDEPETTLAEGFEFSEPVGYSQPTRPSMNTLSTLRHPRSGLARLIDEQPLVLAALGVAVGAAIGSAIPSTDIESQWMGDASQSVKQNASAAARQQLAQLKATAGQTLDQMKATVAEHGATADNLSGLVHDLGDDVRDASNALGRQPADFRSRS